MIWCIAPAREPATVPNMENTRTSKWALGVLDQPPPPGAAPTADVPAGKPNRISKSVRAAISKMVNGDCKKVTDAALLVGLSREHLSRELNRPHIAAFMRQEILRHLNIAAARAGSTKVELLDSDNEIVRDRASTFVLALSDIAPASTSSLNVNLELRAGYCIDLRGDDPTDTMRIVSSTAKPVPIDHDQD